MFEKINTMERQPIKNFLKSLILSGTVFVVGSLPESSQAEEMLNGSNFTLDELTTLQVQELGANPVLLEHANIFYSITPKGTLNFVDAFRQLKEMGITGDVQKAVIDTDGNALIVDDFEQYKDGNCELKIGDAAMPVIISSNSPDICKIEVLYFPTYKPS